MEVKSKYIIIIAISAVFLNIIASTMFPTGDDFFFDRFFFVFWAFMQLMMMRVSNKLGYYQMGYYGYTKYTNPFSKHQYFKSEQSLEAITEIIRETHRGYDIDIEMLEDNEIELQDKQQGRTLQPTVHFKLFDENGKVTISATTNRVMTEYIPVIKLILAAILVISTFTGEWSFMNPFAFAIHIYTMVELFAMQKNLFKTYQKIYEYLIGILGDDWERYAR
jgi:hypothetical protein